MVESPMCLLDHKMQQGDRGLQGRGAQLFIETDSGALHK